MGVGDVISISKDQNKQSDFVLAVSVYLVGDLVFKRATALRACSYPQMYEVFCGHVGVFLDDCCFVVVMSGHGWILQGWGGGMMEKNLAIKNAL